MNEMQPLSNYKCNSNDLRRLRLFVRSLSKRYGVNFTLCTAKCNKSKDYKEELQLKITHNDKQLFYSETPICPATDKMITGIIEELKIIFKHKE